MNRIRSDAPGHRPVPRALRRMVPAIRVGLIAVACLGSVAPGPGLGARHSAAGSDRRCQADPIGSVLAFVEDAGDSLVVGWRGTVISRRDATASGPERLMVRDASGHERRIAFSAVAESLPVRVGATYGFRVEHQGESPRCSAILVWDRRGLLYAAASDTRPGATVLRAGLPGFAVVLDPHRCPSRSHDDCVEAIYNTTLRVSASGKSIALGHGESATFDGWRLHCLTAQEIEYSSHCADAAQVGVAYTLRRAK